MSKQDNGGPAFPRIEPGDSDSGPKIYFGASLRDYFAAKAMQGMLSSPSNGGETDQRIAHWAYMVADAMLAERAK